MINVFLFNTVYFIFLMIGNNLNVRVKNCQVCNFDGVYNILYRNVHELLIVTRLNE